MRLTRRSRKGTRTKARVRRDKQSQAQTLQGLLKAADKDLLGDDALVLLDALEERGYEAIAFNLKKLISEIRAFNHLVPIEIIDIKARRVATYEDIKLALPRNAVERRMFRKIDGSGRRALAELGRFERTWNFLKKMIVSVIRVIDLPEVSWWTYQVSSRGSPINWPVISHGPAEGVDSGQVIIEPLVGARAGKRIVVSAADVHAKPDARGYAPGARAYLPPQMQGKRITSSQQYLREGPRRRW